MAKQKQGEFNTGGDCDTWCNKCKMDLAHTIVAIYDGWPVQVICNTCRSKHRFKKPKVAKTATSSRSASAATSAKPGSPPAKPRRSVAGSATTAPPSVERPPMTPHESRTLWLDLLAKAETKEHRRYTVKENFAAGETLMHKKFGAGAVVEELSSQNKIRVLFQDGEKVLVVNYGKK